ncbi:penicillin-binding protein [Desulfoluna limicola]|uniref:Penicillin-binding protein n=2 Tax=Desulfoluna limicola TaxID=2810562 RepID=A0ABN6EYA6_9BACT|nr:penicillin-binding protein [Desulfoluna limicola]
MPSHTDITMKRLKARGSIIALVFSMAFLVIASQAISLQIFKKGWLTRKAEARFGRSSTIMGKRGTISDRNGNPLAVSIAAKAIGVYPKKAATIEDVPAAAKEIAAALKMDRRTVERALRHPKYNWIKRPVPPEMGAAVAALKVPGVEVHAFHKRVYPSMELAGQLIGASKIDDIGGRNGLEYRYNDILSPTTTNRTVKWDGSGNPVDIESAPLEEISGNNLILTIDSNIQDITETALKKAAVKHKASSGMAVVMRPKTGEILAMANYPGFNPNNFGAFSGETRSNRTVLSNFEPGSTMKVFLVAAALDSGKVERSSIFYCENGAYNIGGYTFHDTHEYEWLTLEQVIKFSSNIAMVKISEIIGKKALYEALWSFGFGQRTGINLNGESKGILSGYSNWNKVETGAVAFGQGVSVTALQLATAYSALANDGMLVKPWIVKEVTDPYGATQKDFQSPEKKRVVTPETARFVKKIMASVTTEGGTGTQAALRGYTVCGKTGTAQKIGPDKRYFKDRYVASFAGFVPMNNPELTIVVILDDPRSGGYYGSVVAGPAFREIAYKTLDYLHVAPETESIPEKLLLALKSEEKK